MAAAAAAATAAAVVSVPANEGISVKNEQDDPEINAMALKMKENFQKSTPTATLRPQGTPIATGIYISRAGRQVPLTTIGVPLPNSAVSKENVDKSSKDCEDAESINGHFGWEMIGTYYVPYIMRIINGECLKFVSVRMAETQLLSGYLHYLHADIYTCTSVRSHFILESEAKLLNEINFRHSDQVYGKEQFLAGKDYIVRLEDVTEFYLFIEVCYKKLLCNIAPSRKEKCGFIRINSESVVPYCLKDDQKYVPLFYFEGETENLRHRAVKLENWNLAYLKFCCKVQGIRNELFASDSCIVTSLDDIKNYFPPDTNFEEYWPAKVVDTQLLNNQKTPHANPPASWIRAPPSVLVLNNAPAPEGIIPHSMPAPTPVAPAPVISVANNSYQNGWPSSSMVNSYNIQAQPQPTRCYSAVPRNQNVAAQYYNSGPTILQQQSSSSMNSVGHIPPPPLVRTSNNPGTTQIVNNAAPYPNVSSLNQPMTTMYNTMTSNVMTHPSQLRQYYSNQRSNNVNQPQPQQMIATPQTQQSYSNHSIPINGPNVRMNVTQPRNALRNITPITTGPPAEIIDLSSPPSSPPPQQAPPVDPVVRHNVNWVLKKVPERTWTHDSTNNAAYKMQKATIQGKIIHGINSKPYIYSDLMVTLEELIQTVLPPCTVARCAYLIQKCLKTSLYSGNSEQIMVLRENRRVRSTNPDDTPLVMLQDVTQVLLQLKSLISKNDEQIHMYSSSAGIPSKRQRMS